MKPKKNQQSRQFKKLRDKWYQILKDEGFEDIEDVNSPNEMLKSWSFKQDFSESREDYYQMATTFLDVCLFDNDSERRIWEMHAEGLTMREISSAFATQGYSTTNVHKIIKKLRTMMLYRFK